MGTKASSIRRVSTMTTAPMAPRTRSSHMNQNRCCPGVPNRFRIRSLSSDTRPKSMATVVVTLPGTADRSSTPTEAWVMTDSVVSGVISETEPTNVVLPTPNPPATTIFADVVVRSAPGDPGRPGAPLLMGTSLYSGQNCSGSHRDVQLGADLRRELETDPLHQAGHRVADEPDVAVGCGEHGEAGPVADGHQEEVAAFHLDDGLLDVAGLEAARRAEVQRDETGGDGGQLFGPVVREAVRRGEQQTV